MFAFMIPTIVLKSFQAKIFKLLLNEMVSVDLLETSDDFDEDDSNDSDEDGQNVDRKNGELDLSKMLDGNKEVYDDNDEDNDFEDPDARCKNIYLPKCVASWVRGPKIEHQFMPTLEYRRIPECWELFLSKELCLIAKELLVVAVS